MAFEERPVEVWTSGLQTFGSSRLSTRFSHYKTGTISSSAGRDSCVVASSSVAKRESRVYRYDFSYSSFLQPYVIGLFDISHVHQHELRKRSRRSGRLPMTLKQSTPRCRAKVSTMVPVSGLRCRYMTILSIDNMLETPPSFIFLDAHRKKKELKV